MSKVLKQNTNLNSIVIPDMTRFNSATVSWDIGRLAAGESRKLSLSPSVLTKDIEKFSAGSSSAMYSSEATVSRAEFERVSGSKVSYTYKDKAEMNVECATILKFVYQQGEVKMIVFTYDKSIWATEDQSWGGVVDSIKKVVTSANNQLINKIGNMEESLSSSVKELKVS